jgi:hypothetical protein
MAWPDVHIEDQRVITRRAQLEMMQAGDERQFCRSGIIVCRADVNAVHQDRGPAGIDSETHLPDGRWRAPL